MPSPKIPDWGGPADKQTWGRGAGLGEDSAWKGVASVSELGAKGLPD